MKKIILYSLILLTLTGIASADMVVKLENPINHDTFLELINAIIDIVIWVAVILAPLMILIGAFYMTTSGSGLTDQKSQIEKGKNIIKYTVIGLILLLGAKGFVYFILEKFGI